MLFLKLIRKFGRLLRGGCGNREIILGVSLAFVLGMLPSFNLTAVLVVAALLILNANLAVAIPTLAISKALCFLLAPISFHIGHALIHSPVLEGFFRFMANAPGAALLDLHVYANTGGIILGVILGLIVGILAAKILRHLRVDIQGFMAKHPRAGKVVAAKPIQVFLRLVFGRQKAQAGTEEQKRPFFRKSGLITAAVVGLLVLGMEIIFLDFLLASGIKKGLQHAVGAEVNVSDAELSLVKGRLNIGELQITNPEKPKFNLFEARQITTDLSISALLAKRIVVDEITMDTLRRDSERKHPGRIIKKAPPEKPAEKPEKVPDTARPILDYFEDAQKIRKYLSRANNYLQRHQKKKRQAKKARRKDLKRRARQIGYLQASAKDLIGKTPTWIIKLLRAENVHLKAGLPPHQLKATHVSSQPELQTAPSTITLRREPDVPPTLALKLTFPQPTQPHTLSLRLKKLNISGLSSSLKSVPLQTENARLDLATSGEFTASELNLPFQLKISGLKVAPDAQNDVFGLDPTTARKLFESLDEIKLTGKIRGRMTAPLIMVDPSSLSDILKRAAKEGIKTRAKKEIREKINKKGKDIIEKEGKKKLQDKVKSLFD